LCRRIPLCRFRRLGLRSWTSSLRHPQGPLKNFDSLTLSLLFMFTSVKVEDLMEVGANIRTGLGIPPRIQKECMAL
ncbi:hypothetical protein Tsubulata_032292, partial [Turnera subulata]